MDDLSITTLMGIGGFVVGALFGALTYRTNFCTMGSISDAVSFGDFSRARAWMLAIAVAILGSQILYVSGTVDLAKSIYLGPSLRWFSNILGGLVFGFGMVLASGCPARNLARVGGGDLKALVVLIFVGMFGYMTMRGLIAPGRVQIEDATNVDLSQLGIPDQHVGSFIAQGLSVSGTQAHIILAVLVSALLAAFCFSNAEFRRSAGLVAVGLGAGVLVTAGWWVTGVLGADEFEPVPLASLTFIAPAGDGLQYLMTYTGATISFGIASVAGAIAGAFIAALAGRTFQMTSFYDKSDTLRHMIGGAMMGVGGVFALGCTIGQGITGMSTLSLGSVMALASIVLGGYMGLKYMEWKVGL